AKSRSFRIRFSTNCRLRSGADRYARDGPGSRSISWSTAALVSFFPLYVATTSVLSTVAAAWGAAGVVAVSPAGSFDEGAHAAASSVAARRRTMCRVFIGDDASPAPPWRSILRRRRQESHAAGDHEEDAGDDARRIHRDVARRRRAARYEHLMELV